MEWTLSKDIVDENAIKKYHKKHPEETEKCFEYLERLRTKYLNAGITVQQATLSGFFRSEGKDVYRIGQEDKRKKETRLYVHLLITGGEIRVLTIGDKDSQQRDIRWCHEWVEKNLRS